MDWIKRHWAKFEHWVAMRLPGWKVKALNAGSAIYVLITAVQAYVSSVPIQDIIETKTAVVLLFTINTLSYWLRDINARVEARKEVADVVVKSDNSDTGAAD